MHKIVAVFNFTVLSSVKLQQRKKFHVYGVCLLEHFWVTGNV